MKLVAFVHSSNELRTHFRFTIGEHDGFLSHYFYASRKILLFFLFVDHFCFDHVFLHTTQRAFSFVGDTVI